MIVHIFTSFMLLAQAAPVDEASPVKEITVLQALRDRRIELDNREADLNAREASLNKIRKQLEDRTEGISHEIAKLEARLNIGEPARQAREKRIVSLVDTMTTLSAKKAAPMLAAADPDLVSELLLRLGPARTAGLLAIMPAPQAGKLLDMVGDAKARAAQKAAHEAAQTALRAAADAKAAAHRANSAAAAAGAAQAADTPNQEPPGADSGAPGAK